MSSERPSSSRSTARESPAVAGVTGRRGRLPRAGRPCWRGALRRRRRPTRRRMTLRLPHRTARAVLPPEEQPRRITAQIREEREHGRGRGLPSPALELVEGPGLSRGHGSERRADAAGQARLCRSQCAVRVACRSTRQLGGAPQERCRRCDAAAGRACPADRSSSAAISSSGPADACAMPRPPVGARLAVGDLSEGAVHWLAVVRGRDPIRATDRTSGCVKPHAGSDTEQPGVHGRVG